MITRRKYTLFEIYNSSMRRIMENFKNRQSGDFGIWIREFLLRISGSTDIGEKKGPLENENRSMSIN